MENNMKKGEHLRFIRKYLGLTQREFGELLGDWGIKDKQGIKGKTPEVIASWESGRRNIPDKILKVIQKNVQYENQKIRWEYLIGTDTFKTINEYNESWMIPVLSESQVILNSISDDDIQRQNILGQLLSSLGYSLIHLQLENQNVVPYLYRRIERSIQMLELELNEFVVESVKDAMEDFELLHKKG